MKAQLELVYDDDAQVAEYSGHRSDTAIHGRCRACRPRAARAVAAGTRGAADERHRGPMATRQHAARGRPGLPAGREFPPRRSGPGSGGRHGRPEPSHSAPRASTRATRPGSRTTPTYARPRSFLRARAVRPHLLRQDRRPAPRQAHRPRERAGATGARRADVTAGRFDRSALRHAVAGPAVDAAGGGRACGSACSPSCAPSCRTSLQGRFSSSLTSTCSAAVPTRRCPTRPATSSTCCTARRRR